MSTRSTIDIEYPREKQADDAGCPEAMRADLSRPIKRSDGPPLPWVGDRSSDCSIASGTDLETMQADEADSPEAMRAELSEFLSRHLDDPAVGWPRRPTWLRRDHAPGGPTSGAVVPIRAAPVSKRPAREIMIVSDRPEPTEKRFSELDQPFSHGRGSDQDSAHTSSRTRSHDPKRERRMANLRIPMDIDPWSTVATLRLVSHSPISPTAPPGRSALTDSHGADPPGGSFVATAAGDESPRPGRWARFISTLRDMLLRWAVKLRKLSRRLSNSPPRLAGSNSYSRTRPKLTAGSIRQD